MAPTRSQRPRRALQPDGRYAPSPTGSLHLGNLRTALLAWLFARSQNARFYMRIEDLDTGRVRPHFADEQLEDLRRLGLNWDGDVVRQSERTHLYEAALSRLRARDLLYECFCTRAEIREAASAPHGLAAEGAYPGTCLTLSARDRADRLRSGRPPAIRVRAGGPEVTVTDRLSGQVTAVVDDFVVRRNDGAFAYNFAVVVDDAEQRIGEVVRGADLLESTPRQVWLAEALGLRPPASFAHVPVMLGGDGDRLAKRHGAVTLADAAAEGRNVVVVRGELASSVGLCEVGATPSLDCLLTAFDPAELPAG